MSNAASNKFKYLLATAGAAPLTDTFKVMLMQSGFSFTPTYNVYADVSANELPTASGYTATGQTLTGISITEDDTLHRAVISWNNPSWLATGGNLVASGAIIYDDTVASDPLVFYIDFGGNITTYDGGTLTLANVNVILT